MCSSKSTGISNSNATLYMLHNLRMAGMRWEYHHYSSALQNSKQLLDELFGAIYCTLLDMNHMSHHMFLSVEDLQTGTWDRTLHNRYPHNTPSASLKSRWWCSCRTKHTEFIATNKHMRLTWKQLWRDSLHWQRHWTCCSSHRNSGKTVISYQIHCVQGRKELTHKCILCSDCPEVATRINFMARHLSSDMPNAIFWRRWASSVHWLAQILWRMKSVSGSLKVLTLQRAVLMALANAVLKINGIATRASTTPNCRSAHLNAWITSTSSTVPTSVPSVTADLFSE